MEIDLFTKVPAASAGKGRKSKKVMKPEVRVQAEFSLGFDAGYRALQVWLASRMPMNCLAARSVLRAGGAR